MADNIRSFLSGGFLVYAVMSWGWKGVGYWILFLVTSFVFWWLTKPSSGDSHFGEEPPPPKKIKIEEI